jgi:hypothetical protein
MAMAAVPDPGRPLLPILCSLSFLDSGTKACVAAACRAFRVAIYNFNFMWYDSPCPRRILILGDGNLSFSLGAAKLLTSKLPVGPKIVATTYDSRDSLLQKYPEAKNILDRMALYIKRGNDCLQIMHNINATAIPRSMGKFSHIIFNHPHLGIENLKTHQMLLSHFFHSCKRHVETGAFYGKVYVSLLDGQGERWQIIDRARRRGFKCKYVLPFSTSSYDVKRTRNGKSFKSTITKKNNNSTLKSFMYCFSILREGEKAELNIMPGQKRKLSPTALPKPSVKRAPKPAVKAISKTGEFYCKECDKSFLSAQGIKTHRHMVHTLNLFDRTKKWECIKCPGRTFTTADGLYQHNVAKHSDQECNNIDEKNSGDFVNKEQRAASSPRKRCDVCGMDYKGSYRHHILNLAPLREPDKLGLQCRFCSKCFLNERARTQHERFCSMQNDDKAEFQTLNLKSKIIAAGNYLN